VLALAVGLVAPDGFTVFLQLVLAFALELSVYRVVKARFSRPRPFTQIPFVTMLIPPPDEFSFPWGHTAAAFVMVIVIGVHAPAAGLLLLDVRS